MTFMDGALHNCFLKFWKEAFSYISRPTFCTSVQNVACDKPLTPFLTKGPTEAAKPCKDAPPLHTQLKEASRRGLTSISYFGYDGK